MVCDEVTHLHVYFVNWIESWRVSFLAKNRLVFCIEIFGLTLEKACPKFSKVAKHSKIFNSMGENSRAHIRQYCLTCPLKNIRI